MHTTSELYKTILADPAHEKEIKLDIAGVEYGMDSIVSCATSGALFETFVPGNAVSAQIDIEIIPKGTIPRQAKIQLYVRLKLGDSVSEWIPKGVFFFASRKTDKATGIMTATGYDSMLKAESVWLTSDYDDVNWPLDPSAAAKDIASRLGVELDSRTELDDMFPVDYPVDENGDMTMRQVLCGLAVANCGNWCMTDEGKLRLVPCGNAPAETNYLVSEIGDIILFGGVRILVG